MLDALLREPGVLEECTLGSSVGFMAMHGGSLERGTAEIAREAAHRSGASLYAVIQPHALRWHVPSIRFDPRASANLASFLGHVDVAISVHGFGRRDRPRTILLGGGNRDLAATIAALVRVALPAYDVVDDLDRIPIGMRGVHPANPVNRPRRRGVQLELPVALRGCPEDREALAAALAKAAEIPAAESPRR